MSRNRQRISVCLVAASIAIFALSAVSVGQTPEPAPAVGGVATGEAPSGDEALEAAVDGDATDEEDPFGEDALITCETVAAAEAEAAGDPETPGIAARVDAQFSKAVDVLAAVLFYQVPGITIGEDGGIPIIVVWLFLGAVILTVKMGFVNVRAFRHALDVVRGKFDDPDAEGEVNHLQALSSALSATVGLGNIAGVAVAVSVGGAGAVFWMLVAAAFGMTSKFVECTLGQKYRTIDSEGTVMGGPMRYLHVGLEEKGLGGLGKVLAIVFAFFCIGGSFGGGNMFQANQAYQAFNSVTPFNVPSPVFGIVMMVLVGIVILGGIKRIAKTAEKIVPLMCSIYVIAALFVVMVNLDQLPMALDAIFNGAFSRDAATGGFIGVMIQGIQRAAFSNEAGIGSASIAHSAAKTSEPVREGLVALLEPFIDTIVVCLATAIVIVISGVTENPDTNCLEGAMLTAAAFQTVISWFPLLLTTAILLFAFSTMISWSYYGERCWTNLFGPKSTVAYRILFLIFIFIGSVSNMTAVLGFSDLMILSMAFPNVLGMYIMMGDVRRDLDGYMGKLKDGKFKRYD